jgi:hypothetical protein
MRLATYIWLLDRWERTLRDSYHRVACSHAEEADVFHICLRLAEQCHTHVDQLAPLLERYGEDRDRGPDRLLHEVALGKARTGGIGLLRDLRDLYLLASYVDMAWTLAGQVAQGAHDERMVAVADACDAQTVAQVTWLTTRLEEAAPGALLGAE